MGLTSPSEFIQHENFWRAAQYQAVLSRTITYLIYNKLALTEADSKVALVVSVFGSTLQCLQTENFLYFLNIMEEWTENGQHVELRYRHTEKLFVRRIYVLYPNEYNQLHE